MSIAEKSFENNYTLFLLNKEKMKLVKDISFLKNNISEKKKWIENLKINASEFINEEWYESSLDMNIRGLNESNNILTVKRHQLMDINNAIAVLKKFG